MPLTKINTEVSDVKEDTMYKELSRVELVDLKKIDAEYTTDEEEKAKLLRMTETTQEGKDF